MPSDPRPSYRVNQSQRKSNRKKSRNNHLCLRSHLCHLSKPRIFTSAIPMSRKLLAPGDRSRHVYISGKTQQGKSTLIHAMCYQDMRNGDGLCVIDAKGDLIPKLIHWVPRARMDDCIVLDLKSPTPLDFMARKDQDERTTLVSDIIQ